MSEAKLEVKILKLDEIRPNPFQPRESFPKEEIQQLANSIKEVGLLQPVTVRRKGKTYQIVSGERRWRAAQFASLKEIPVLIKDVSDSELMVESLIENVHRKDLEPIEKARGLKEIYRLAGFDPAVIQTKLRTIEDKRVRPKRHEHPELTEEEKKIEKVAEKIALSFDYQYRLLSQLRLSPKEQKRVTQLKLGYEKIASISAVKEEEARKKLIEIAPTLERAKVKTVSKVVRKGPEPLKEAVLERKIEPEIAEEILKIEEPQIQEKAVEIAKKGVYSPTGMKMRIEQMLRPKMKLPAETVETQMFNKTMWNLQRVGDFDFYTIGYEKKTIEQFLQLLETKKIHTLLDVRRTPISQFKPEFSKENLARTLRKYGINYQHYRELGVPTDIRKKLADTGDFEQFFKWYDKNVVSKLEEVDLENLGYPIAVMCVEYDPTKCHRHRIALALETRGLRGIDL